MESCLGRCWGRTRLCLAITLLAGTSAPALAQFADACADAPSVGEGIHSFSLLGASAGADPVFLQCIENPASIDQWVRYTPTFSGPVQFSTLGLSSGDTVLSVHAASEPATEFDCAFAGFQVDACNDNFGGTQQSRVVLVATAGQPMLVRVAGANDSRPTGAVRIEAFNPPAGDLCGNPLPATSGVNTFDVTQAVVNPPTGACRNFRDVWYSYTAPVSGALTLSTCGQGDDTNIAVFTSCGGTVLGCTEYGECSMGTAVQGGVPILIRVANDAATGPLQFTLSLNPGGIPSNDACATPAPAALGNTAFDNTFATDGPTISCGPGGLGAMDPGLDVWFSFTPAVSGTYDISTEESLGISATQLVIFGDCSGEAINCNAEGRGFLSFIRTPLTGGQAYLIQVSGTGRPTDGTPTDRGAGVLSIRRSIPPVNDECASATTIGAGVTQVDVYDATTGSQAPDCVPEQTGTRNDVWYRYVPTTTGPVEAGLTSGDGVSSLSYFASCGSMTATQTAGIYYDPATQEGEARLLVDGVAGVPLFFRVAYSLLTVDPMMPSGDATLRIGAPTAPVLPNDLCSRATLVGAGTIPINLAGSIKDCTQQTSAQFDSSAAPTDNDVFFRFDALQGENLSITINDGVDYPAYDGLVVSVYDSCGGAPLAGSLAFGDAPLGALDWEVPQSGQYLIRVGSILRFGQLGVQTGSITISTGVSCPADLDNGTGTGTPDGGVDVNDLLYFLLVFENGTEEADLDNGTGTGTPDGGVDVNDLLFFLVRFEAGC